jgi:hypothetical protein
MDRPAAAGATIGMVHIGAQTGRELCLAPGLTLFAERCLLSVSICVQPW